MYIYTLTHTHAHTYTQTRRKLCVLAITLRLEDEADGWCLKGDKIKATSFHGLQIKAQKGHQDPRVQRARRAASQLAKSKNTRENDDRRHSEGENDNLCVSLARPAGHSRADCF